MMKLVIATVMEVNVGLAKPISVKMVAEKYMREFCSSALDPSNGRWEATHEAAKLLEALQ
jgi:hypothetical protein